LWIEVQYYNDVTGDLEKAQQVNEILAQKYPRSWMPRNELGANYQKLGCAVKALVHSGGIPARELVRSTR
jgi:hypothetical protein